MRILGIDTSSENATAAIFNESGIFGKNICDKVTHSQKLLTVIDSLLKEQSTSLNNIDLFACGVGPGSFTGLRIGIATIKAFAQVGNKNIVSVPTLDILAYSAIKNYKFDNVISIIDARNDLVYAGIYTVDNNLMGMSLKEDYSVFNINDLLNYLRDNIEGSIIFVGSGASVYTDKIKENNNVNFNISSNTYDVPDAKYLVEMASKIPTTEYVSYNNLFPLYLRASQAERVRIDKSEK